MIFNEKAKVVSNKQVAANIFEAILYSPKISESAAPGQFINILPHRDWSNVMRRPMSVAWQKDNEISIIYKVFGRGTKIISEWSKGDIVDIVGPLGNKWSGYKDKMPILIGGGVGIAPILNLHKHLSNIDINHMLIMGARYKNEHFINHNPDKRIYVCTELEDWGFKGNVISALDEIGYNDFQTSKIFACGPPGMMKAVARYSEGNNIDCDLALETIMACGIGICQGCSIVRDDNTSNTYRKKYALACIDGPIFNVKELNNAFL